METAQKHHPANIIHLQMAAPHNVTKNCTFLNVFISLNDYITVQEQAEPILPSWSFFLIKS